MAFNAQKLVRFRPYCVEMFVLSVLLRPRCRLSIIPRQSRSQKPRLECAVTVNMVLKGSRKIDDALKVTCKMKRRFELPSPSFGGSRDTSRISHRRKKSPHFKASRNRLDSQPNFIMATSIAGAPLFSAARARTAVLSPSSTIALSQCRQFSLSAQYSALQKGMPQTLSVKQPSQPSMKSRGQNMSRSELPQDIGLLPGTYIRPLWRDMPSIFQQPRERLHFEWLWVKSWFQNFLG